MLNWLTSEVTKCQGWSFRHWARIDVSDTAQAAAAADTLDELLTTGSGAIKHDQTTTVKKAQLAHTPIVIKRYNPRSVWHKIKRCLRGTRAERCWRMSYRFQRAGLMVAPPVLMHERRWGPFRGDAYFITEYLSGNELLELLPRMTAKQRSMVAAQITDAFETMRREKLSHGDMKASNLLWVNERLFFIDLDAAREHLTGLGWQRAHARDLKRFLKNWRSNEELLALFSHLS